MKEVNLKLPKLEGKNIEEHFHNIATYQVEPYQELIASIVKADLPEPPKVSKFRELRMIIKNQF